MTTAIATTKGNENNIVWEPVKTTGVFTSIDSTSKLFGVYVAATPVAQALSETPKAKPTRAPGACGADSRETHYNEMLRLAERFPPDQSWFDEDFNALRHSR